jgi:hypothetical protein
MLQAATSEEGLGRHRLKLDIRNSLVTMETARMHFDWVKGERELRGGRATKWNEIYKVSKPPCSNIPLTAPIPIPPAQRFQLLSLETKDACSHIENFGRRRFVHLRAYSYTNGLQEFDGEISKFLASKSKRARDCKAFVRWFMEVGHPFPNVTVRNACSYPIC